MDVAVLGAMQVAANGDLANWAVPGGRVNGMGGAMDLVSGAQRVLVISTLRTKTGKCKLVHRCDLPLTGLGCVTRVITDQGVFDPTGEAFKIVELAPGVRRENLGGDLPLVP